MDLSKLGFSTRSVHAGAGPDATTGARAVPIYQTTSYEDLIEDLQQALERSELK